MDYSKLILSTTTLSLGVIGNVGAVDIESNSNEYIKLASIFPISESRAVVAVKANRISSDDKIIKKCVADGYKLGMKCPPVGQESLNKEIHCGNSDETAYNYIKCTCYSNVSALCDEKGYDKTSCEGGWELDKECPIDKQYMRCKAKPCTGYSENECSAGYKIDSTCEHGDETWYKCKPIEVEQCTSAGYVLNKTCSSSSPVYEKTLTCPENESYKKCIPMTASEKCIKDGYSSNGSCSGYYKPKDCEFDALYKKCEPMTDAEKCIKDGYEYNKTCSGYYKLEGCDYISQYFKCIPMTNQEKCNRDGYNLTSCSVGYSLTDKCEYGDYYRTCEKNASSGDDCSVTCGRQYDYGTTGYNCCMGYDDGISCLKYDRCVETKPKVEACPSDEDSGNQWCYEQGYIDRPRCQVGQTVEECPCPNSAGFGKCVDGELIKR
jgi:hypothetical protein